MPDSDSNLDLSILKELHQPSRAGRKIVNLIGRKFDRVTPLGFLGLKDGAGAQWLCHCDCGKIWIVTAAKLLRHRQPTRSCGCLTRGTIGEKSATHRMSQTRIYRLWADMNTRALNPNYKQAKDYSERGIGIDERWRTFENFIEDMGQPPSTKHSIERRDNNLGYSKENCYWATKKQQARNTRANRTVTIRGETYCLAEWAERSSLRPQTVYSRLKRGWSIEEALNLTQRTNKVLP